MSAWLDYAIKLLPTIVSGCSICLALIWRVHALQLKQEIINNCIKVKENLKDEMHKMEIELIDRINKKRS